jgi:hypothetical protein
MLPLALLALAAQRPAQKAPAPPKPLFELASKETEPAGYVVRPAGDVNDDGFGDLIVGAPFGTKKGKPHGSARVISGKNASVLLVLEGRDSSPEFGSAVDGAGDVNGDGLDDVIVGDPGDPRGGAAWIYSGRTGEVLEELRPKRKGTRFGASVAGAGDVDRDGLGDVIVGAPDDEPNGPKSGSASLYKGKNGELIRTLTGRRAGDQYGASVSGAGDVNGDVFADVIVGAPQIPSAGDGFAEIRSGHDGRLMHELVGGRDLRSFGASVRGAGDVNSDGLADVIIAAPDARGGGKVLVVSGHSGERLHFFSTPEDLASLEGQQHAAFGFSISGAGDVDNDGYADVVVGAPRALREPGKPVGAVFVVSGKKGLLLEVLWGPEPASGFGWSVSGAGDANADSYADVAVGAPGGSPPGAENSRVYVFSGASLGR